MNLKHAIPVLAATLLIAGSAVADDQGKGRKNKNRNQDRASTSAAAASFGQGVAEANRRGARADAVIGSQTESRRQGRNGQAAEANTSTTFGTGAIFTDRRTPSGAVSTGATASGTGEQNTSSSVEAFGETTRQGSNAEVFGDSAAQSQPRQRRPR